MPLIVLITSAWGPKQGGINSFNTDLAKALGLLLRDHPSVVCVTQAATPEDVEDAAQSNVALLALGGRPETNLDEHSADKISQLISSTYPQDTVLWWIGHDIVSGFAAASLPRISGQGHSAAIHHMSYIDYATYKHGKATKAQEKSLHQERVFTRVDKVLAVGPLLQKRLADMLGKDISEVSMLIPGLPPIEPSPTPNTFKAITFGRLDPENDRIKQGRLAVASFSKAIGRAASDRSKPRHLRDNPQLYVIGLSESDGEEERQLQALARDRAGQVVTLLSLPYSEDRDQLFNTLRKSSIAMMLSWHEGFGLTGWEAIAAEVPLIVSQNSGLYMLIDSLLGGAGIGCVKAIHISGELDFESGGQENFQLKDEEAVTRAIEELAADPERAKKDAKMLRVLLQANAGVGTWHNAAQHFASLLNIAPAEHVVAPTIIKATTASPPHPISDNTQLGASLLFEGKPRIWRPGMGIAESQLLRPEEECVPFHRSRRELLDEVINWATNPTGLPVEVQFRIGVGGSGKTRLMLQACKELESQGWKTGFLSSAPSKRMRSALNDTIKAGHGTFIVLDYAETRREQLVDLIEAAFSTDGKHRIRIMLLAREAGEWWDSLLTDYTSIERYLTGRAVSGPYRIPPIPTQEQSRGEIFAEALDAFSRELDKDTTNIPTPDLSGAHFSQVLFIHLSALAALSGERPETATALLEATLRRERRYWYKSASEIAFPKAIESGIDQAMALLTLGGGAATTAGSRWFLEITPRLRAASDIQKEYVFSILHSFYPNSNGIEPLRPDILGERLVSYELARDDALLDVALGGSLGPPATVNALAVLNRLARQNPSEAIWLKRGLRRNVVACARHAIRVAIESGDPLGKILAETIEEASDPEKWELVNQLHGKVPDETVALRECALVVANLHLNRLLKGDTNGRYKKERLAAAYSELGRRLFGVGRFEEALSAEQHAKPLRAELAKSNTHEDISKLGGCLHNIGNHLDELGRYEEALEYQQASLPLLRRCVALAPRRHLVGLSTVLNNMANTLRSLGRLDEALKCSNEALQIRQDIAKQPNNSAVFHLATSLSNTANILEALGRFDEALQYAQRSVELWRKLAEARPDAFRRKYSLALLNLSNHLSNSGKYDKGLKASEESAAIMRELAEARPNIFRSDVALSLAALSSKLFFTGRRRESIQCAEESLHIARELAESSPESFNNKLSSMLGNVAAMLVSLGQNTKALEYLKEASALNEEILRTRPQTIEPEIARHGHIRASALFEMGYCHEASHHAENALDLYRALSIRRSDAFLSQTLSVVSLIAAILAQLGQLNRARELLLSASGSLDALLRSSRLDAVIIHCAYYLSIRAEVEYKEQRLDEALQCARQSLSLFEKARAGQRFSNQVEAAMPFQIISSIYEVEGDMDKQRVAALEGIAILEADFADFQRPLSLISRTLVAELVRLSMNSASASTHPALFASLALSESGS